MATPLTRKTEEGRPYVRPPPVEAAIDEAIGLDEAEVVRRAKAGAGQMPHECVVHLIRDAHRRGRRTLEHRLLGALLERCSVMVERKLRGPRWADVRDEVLSQVGLLFAMDGARPEAGELDYYEVRFLNAFDLLRRRVMRAGRRRAERFPEAKPSTVALDDEKDGEGDDASIADLDQEQTFAAATQESAPRRAQILRAIDELPPEEREAVVLCHVMDLDVESEDPDKTTAASVTRVDGRTVRRRLARAAKKLSRFKEES
jgi:DNA-directed RNA polymerase specialized sigma24 family protein